jgi:hypothetical protein
MDGTVGAGRGLRSGGVVGAALAWLGHEFGRVATNRRVLHRLSVMSDRELRDIGLIRQDLQDADLPGVDAVAFLRERRDARRRRTPRAA